MDILGATLRTISGIVIGANLIVATISGQVRQESKITADPKVVSGAQYSKIIENLRGKPVMVNFWATWCEPCREEFPRVNELAKKYRSRLVVLGVSWDEDAEMGIVRRFLAKYRPVFRNYRKKPGNEAEFVRSIHPQWSGSLPTTFFYAPDGTIAGFLVGEQGQGDFEKAIQDLLDIPGKLKASNKSTSTNGDESREY